ncbi:UDP-4-amino-4,6-dideoxy-N-acetyl-beta-L-altrosamine transaminase [Candidatus Falkowbacteria bacterium]|nr:UDP-4-amino-4,6-dideoxy-N-acetyl-beta-L-altrosamine transaminase [Candidatus Falkowbacteria bacterium]
MTRQLRLPYGRQTIDQQDLNAVNNVMESDWLTQGPNVFEFEEKLAHYCGAQFAVVVSNGTAALHLANLALKADAGSKVITTPISFVATCNSVLYAGSTPMFCDIIPETLNINPVAVRKCLRSNPDVVGIIPVHMGGLIADMEALSEIAKANDMWVIEDACHALGGSWLDSKGVEHRVGDCSFSDMTVFSFHPVKMITTGEGGAIMTNNKQLEEKIALLRSHGISKNSKDFKNDSDGDWYYEQQVLGFNYRLTDIQAALGISQLKRLDSFVEKRREIAKRYLNELKNVTLPYQHPDANSSWHLFVVKIKDRKAVYQQLKVQGIMTQVHYIPVTQQPFYHREQLKNSDSFYQQCLSLPIYADLTSQEHSKVIKSLWKINQNC